MTKELLNIRCCNSNELIELNEVVYMIDDTNAKQKIFIDYNNKTKKFFVSPNEIYDSEYCFQNFKFAKLKSTVEDFPVGTLHWYRANVSAIRDMSSYIMSYSHNELICDYGKEMIEITSHMLCENTEQKLNLK